MVPGRQKLEARPGPAEAAPAGLARIEDLTVTFLRNGEKVHALRGVSLDLVPGEIVGVVGESGSGKSVLGLSLLGLLPDRPRPQISGSVTVKDVDMVNAPAEHRRLVRRRHMGCGVPGSDDVAEPDHEDRAPGPGSRRNGSRSPTATRRGGRS